MIIIMIMITMCPNKVKRHAWMISLSAGELAALYFFRSPSDTIPFNSKELKETPLVDSMHLPLPPNILNCVRKLAIYQVL